MPEAGGWAIVVHGGCKEIPASQAKANRDGCEAATRAGMSWLAGGGSAVDAVEAAIRVLENDPAFNAGRGSVLNADGEMELDAGLMEGSHLDLGAVAAIKQVRNPIRVARALLQETPSLLAGDGALRFAQERGLDTPPLSGPSHGSGVDTVGCIARDKAGRLAAGTSTGGLAGKRPGRVGDSPLPGCGLYADDRIGAVSLSGDGESIARTLLGARVILALEQGVDADVAVQEALGRLPRVGGEAGVIAMDRNGRIGWSHRGAQFAVAWATEAEPAPQTRLSLHEARVHG
jgi:beta-aspartyl-peptidase (threonine type)